MSVYKVLRVHTRHFHIPRFVYTGVLALWLTAVGIVPVASAQSAEQLIAQKPFVSTVVEGMALTKTNAGVPMAVLMPQAINSLLEVINLKTMQRVLLDEQRVDGLQASGRAVVTLPNRHVIIATTTGFVYDINPDTLGVVEQELPSNVQKLTFQRAILGDNGQAYFAGTSETGARLYSFTFKNSTWRDMGAIPSAENGLAYAAGAVYGGVRGQNANVWRMNVTQTGQTPLATQGLPSGVRSITVEAVDSDFLYASAQTNTGVTLVYDLKQSNWVDQKPAFGKIALAPEEPVVPAATVEQKTVVQTAPSTSGSPSTESGTNTGTTGTNTGTSGTGDGNGNSTPKPNSDQPKKSDETSQVNQSTTTSTASNGTNQASTATNTPPASNGQVASAETPTTVAPTPGIVAAPKPVYYGGFNQYDPASKSIKTYTTNQNFQPVSNGCWIDSVRCVVYTTQGRLAIATIGSKTLKVATPSPVVGGFQPADMLAIDAGDVLYAASSSSATGMQQTANDKAQTRKIVDTLGSQLTSLATVDKVAVVGTADGMILDYKASDTASPRFNPGVKAGNGGIRALVADTNSSVIFALNPDGDKPSGSIGQYSVSSHKITSAPQTVLNDQAVSAVAVSGGVVYVGGTAGAGSGGAALAAYDVAKHKLIARTTPVHGAAAITSLTVGNNGTIYGVADGTMFALSPVTLSVTHTKALATKSQAGTIVVSQDKLVASVAGKIYHVDPSSLNETYVVSGSHVAVNSAGDIYYTRSGGLYRFNAARPSTVSAVSTQALPAGLSPVDLKLGASGGLLAIMLIALPIMKLHTRRHSYALKR